MKKMNRLVLVLAGVGMIAGSAHAQAPALGELSVIDGKDTNWRLVADKLETGKCYEVTVGSTVLYSPAHKNPTRLRISTKGAAQVERTWESTGKKVIQEKFQITATGPQLALRMVDIDATDNTGKLRVKVEPCPAGDTSAPPLPPGS